MTRKDKSKRELSEQEQNLVINYLLDEMSQTEKDAFEEKLKNNSRLGDAVKIQQELDSLCPQNFSPMVSQKRLDGVHWATQKSLRKAAKSQPSVISAIGNLLNLQVSFKAQFASMLVMFGLGFALANLNQPIESTPSMAQSQRQTENIQSTQYAMQPVKYIKNGDFEVTDLSLNKLDPSSGKVELTYSLASQTSVKGNVDSPEIQGLLASTIKNEVSDQVRLDLIELLKNYAESKQVQDALSHSLLNDPNPGVRIAAAESLAKMSHNKKVRDILRQALSKDVNPGIRVEAFQALSKHLEDKDTIKIFKQFSVKDSNQFIREQSQKLIANPKNI